MSEKTLRVSKIKNGTVIDHITHGHALDVLRVLGITGHEGIVVTVAMNIFSNNLGRKDIVKIDGRELKTSEVDKIALLAPHATINIIRDYEVIEKKKVSLPTILHGIFKCINPTCISNGNEPIHPTFYIGNKEPLQVKCHYCGLIMDKEDLLKQF